MQKKIIALAIAAAFSAPAFADTTVYGLVDAAIARISADGQKSDMLAVSGGLATSRIGVNSAEDLGNGLKAVVNLEYSLDAQQSDGIGAARQEMLAVAGNFGTVATGYLQTTGFDFGKSFDPTAGSTVSPLGNVTKPAFLIGTVAIAARAPRALAYISPDMSGLTIAVNYSTSFTGTAGGVAFGNANGDLTKADNAVTGLKTTATMLSANYKMGKELAVGVVYAKANDTNPGAASTTETAFGASYDLEMAKLFATYQVQKTDGVDDIKAMSISAVVPVGPGNVALSYAKNNSVVGSAKGMTVAWLQGLSKTTTFYAAYTRMGQAETSSSYSVANNLVAGSTAAGWTAGGGSSSMIAVGLSKKF